MNLPVIDVTKTAIALHQGREKVVRREERPASAHNHGLAVRFMGKAYRRGSNTAGVTVTLRNESRAKPSAGARKENHLSVGV